MTTPVSISGDLVTYSIKVAGSPIPDSIAIKSIQIEKKVNRISLAKITILDGEPDKGTFEVSSSSLFVPGNLISIEAGYDGTNAVIFTGIITGQSIRIDELIGSAMEVECRDEAIKMTVGQKNATFSELKDSDIITSLIVKYGTLTADVSKTAKVWPSQVQYSLTDWDFMVSLAGMNGLIVTAINGIVSVKAPGFDSNPVMTVSYGTGLLQFNANMDALTQLESVKTSSWDYTTQSVNSATAAGHYTGPGNISPAALAQVIGLNEYELQTTARMENESLNNWAKAKMLQADYAKIRGEAKFQGTSLVDPGKFITITGLGDRFNGDYIISGVTHNIMEGNWITEVSVGLSPEWLIEKSDRTDSGVLSAGRGLFNGTVKQIYNDPEMQYRILVDVPMFNQNGQGIWARLASFYATSGAGTFFMPEVGDEVVLGFLNEDSRSPVILGSMYSNSRQTPSNGLNPNETNAIKAFVTKSNISIRFDDENKVLTIATPAQNTIIFNDKDKEVSIRDENSNSITMSASGISIKSPKNISIEAGLGIKIAGEQGAAVQANGGDVNISGLNIKQHADMEFSAMGSMTAQIKSGMELTLNSAMIMIN
ncbi:type VI secretion system tip protein VgrG [Pedobacter sp. HDW13]|uniref:type VI secretion system tip protein VgrG n=1 Tax=unclassified Pedobacter TaxID=2628915 RepID=UPI000F5ACA84|nr:MULTISPECIES: type VI secretion system tip protein VgrG [unclassified Pedobacter]QIL41551.1 type VI secretion system tip protein VgrG [Pedobacter sp. HDW13]RQO77873.1 Rhs element Vgr protein [Pedobacter sp. KBW01]